MRILFVCNTLYQIIGACCIRKMFATAEAEIVLSDHSTANKDICDNIQREGILFNKAYYVETKYLYEYDASISRKKKNQLLKEKNTVLSMLNLSNKYDMFFCANAEPFTERIVNYVKNTNSNVIINWFEDGLSAYYYDQCYFPNFIRKIKCRAKKILLKVYTLTAYVDNYYVFKPENLEWKPKAKVKKIEPISKELAIELGVIFNISQCTDEYREKYIFFEDGAQDWEKAADVKLMNMIAEKIGKDNIIVRIHPRNPVNRFKEAGFKTTHDTSIPWEIIAANIDIENKVLMTMYSQCVVTPDILMGIKGKVISLAMLDSEYKSIHHEVYDYMKQVYFEKDKEHYIVPESMEEFEELIRKL